MFPHPVYKGCMRPAMLLGIPLLPCLLLLGIQILLAVIITPLLFLFMPVSLIIMRLMVSKDEDIFNIIFLNFLVKVRILHSKLTKYRDSSLSVVAS
jgi:type IV secretory pathway VirB3-like protein